MGDALVAVLITRVEDDELTLYCSKWVEKEVIPEAQARGIEIIDLKREKAVRKEVEGRIKSLNPELLLFNGHGDPSTICGHQGQPLIEDGKNSAVLNGKIVHSLTCDSASILGKNSVNSYGTKTFIGYTEKFIGLTDDMSVTAPLKDEIARPFMESAMAVSKALVKGNTAGEAYRKSQDMYRYWISYYRAKSESKDASDILLYLGADMEVQVLLGDANASV